MEENQNVNENPQKKKMGKKKKIIIALLVLIVVAIVTVAVLGFTGIIDLNLTKKSKADAGIEKVSEVFTEAANDLETELNDAGLVVKVFEKENIEEAESSVNVSFDIKKFESEEFDDEDVELLDDIIDLVNQVEVGALVKSDSEGSFNAKLDAKVGNESISIETTYDGEKIGVRSEELNEKWLALDMQEILDGVEIDEESMKELEEIMGKVQKLVEDFVLTEEEMEHFKSTYSNIIKDYVISLDIESEKDKIDVGDKEKNCTKTTITLDGDDIKNLLISCVESVENDEKGQDIVKAKIKLICDFIIENEDLFESAYNTYPTYPDYSYDYYDDYYYDDYDYGYSYDSYTDYNYDYSPIDDVKEFAENLDEIFVEENFNIVKEAIESLDMEDIEITIETYSSLTTVYATNIIFEVDGEGVVLEMTFDGDKTYATLKMKSSGMSMDMMDVTLVNEKNHKSIEIKAADDVVDYMGTEMSAKVACDISDNNLKTTLELNLGEEGNMVFTQDLNVKVNTDSEYVSTSSNNLKFKVEDVIDLDITMNIDMSLRTANVKVSKIDNCIDFTEAAMTEELDEATMKELQQYVEDAIPNVKDILKGLKSVDIIDENLSSYIDDIIEELDNVSFDTKGEPVVNGVPNTSTDTTTNTVE